MTDNAIDVNKPLPEAIRQRLEDLVRTTKKLFAARHHLMQIFFLLTDDGRGIIVPADDFSTDEAKDAVAAQVKSLSEAVHPLAIVLISESWTINTKDFAEYMNLDIAKAAVPKDKAEKLVSDLMLGLRSFYKLFYASIEKMPGCREHISVMVESIWGDWHLLLPIVRPANGPCHLQDGEWQHMERSGRFSDLLPKTTYAPEEK